MPGMKLGLMVLCQKKRQGSLWGWQERGIIFNEERDVALGRDPTIILTFMKAVRGGWEKRGVITINLREQIERKQEPQTPWWSIQPVWMLNIKCVGPSSTPGEMDGCVVADEYKFIFNTDSTSKNIYDFLQELMNLREEELDLACSWRECTGEEEARLVTVREKLLLLGCTIDSDGGPLPEAVGGNRGDELPVSAIPASSSSGGGRRKSSKRRKSPKKRKSRKKRRSSKKRKRTRRKPKKKSFRRR